MASAPSLFSNSRSITHLANYLSQNSPMNSSDESKRETSRFDRSTYSIKGDQLAAVSAPVASPRLLPLRSGGAPVIQSQQTLQAFRIGPLFVLRSPGRGAGKVAQRISRLVPKRLKYLTHRYLIEESTSSWMVAQPAVTFRSIDTMNRAGMGVCASVRYAKIGQCSAHQAESVTAPRRQSAYAEERIVTPAKPSYRSSDRLRCMS
jgi:hypothetical protein